MTGIVNPDTARGVVCLFGSTQTTEPLSPYFFAWLNMTSGFKYLLEGNNFWIILATKVLRLLLLPAP